MRRVKRMHRTTVWTEMCRWMCGAERAAERNFDFLVVKVEGSRQL